MSETDLFEQFAVAYKELEESEKSLMFFLKPVHAWALLSAVQLASKHPGFSGPTCKLAREIAIEMQQMLFHEGVLGEVARRGWNPDFDK